MTAALPAAGESQTLVPKGATWKYLDDGSDQTPISLSSLDRTGFTGIPFQILQFFGIHIQPEKTSIWDILKDSGIWDELNNSSPATAVEVGALIASEMRKMALADLLRMFGFETFLGFFELNETWEESGGAELSRQVSLGVLFDTAGVTEEDLVNALEEAGVLEALRGITPNPVLSLLPVEPVLSEITLGRVFAALPSWRRMDFDDSDWKEGDAQFGYGDGDEETVVESGPEEGRFITTYFRHVFEVDDTSEIASLTLHLLRDDGAVVYLNEVEVARSNMPSGNINSRTTASSAVEGPAESAYFVHRIPAELLRQGSNILAVEIHQVNGASDDLSFDCELIGSDIPGLSRGPYLQTGTDTGVIIRWRTDVAARSIVSYGLTPDELDQTVEIEAITKEHQVPLSGLQPETRYYYAVASEKGVIASGLDYSFVTGVPPGEVRPVRVWVIGDSGTANTNAAAVRDAYYNFTADRRTDLWLMLGDNAYETGTDLEYQRAVFEMYPSMLRQVYLYSTLGNHDAAHSTTPNPNSPYFQMFSFPTNGEAGGIPSGTESYYSFDYANIHFVCLNSMTENRRTGPMLQWLESDLAANEQNWIIAFFHHPPYTKGSHDSDREADLIEMRQYVLPILEKYGTDLVLTGHSHSYERSYLLDGHYGASSTLNPETMIKDSGNGRVGGDGAYQKAGPGGTANEGSVYIVAGSSGKISGGSLNHPVMFRSLNELGSLVMDIQGNRLDAKFLNSKGNVQDYFTLFKNTAGNQAPQVTFTSPKPDKPLPSPSNIRVAVNAVDPDGVNRVFFYESGTNLLSIVNQPPYEFWMNDVLEGVYQLSAVAVDELEKSSDPVSLTVEVVPAIQKVVRTEHEIYIYFFAKAGERYLVEYTDSLMSNQWQTLLEVKPEPRHSNYVVVDRIVSNHRYFRLRKP